MTTTLRIFSQFLSLSESAKFVSSILFCIILDLGLSAQSKSDTNRHKTPTVGYEQSAPLYYSCSPGRYPDGFVFCETVLSGKRGLDSFVWMLEVHSDCRSDSLYNIRKTQKEADSLVAYMRRKCHDSISIIPKGMGENRPVNDCICEGKIRVPCTETQHQENRRMVFKIIGRREF